MTVAFFAFFAPSAQAQAPSAGTIITNQFMTEYTTGLSQEVTYSNFVSTQVLPVYAIQLTPAGTVAAPAYTLSGAGGDTLYCQFDIANLGNARDSVEVSYRVVPPSNTTIGGMIFFDDANGNGTFDPGEDDPSFLGLDRDEVVPMDAAVILPAGAFGGNAYVEISAVSVIDSMATPETSVIRVFNTDAPEMMLFLGPRGNARALPGGEGSGDDLTVGALGYSDATYSFDNDVFNQGVTPDVFEVSLPDTSALPPGVLVSFADSTGQQMPQSPGSPSAFLIGTLQPGETRPIRVQVSSVSGPLYNYLTGPLSLDVRARSTVDTLQQNYTTDRLVPPQRFNPMASLALNQAFHEPAASLGDIVTFLVTAQNITDSVRVDNVSVVEWVQPQLDFLSSPHFIWNGTQLVWSVGTLAGGESRTGVIKFVVNGRVSDGKAKVVGNVSGVAENGDPVSAGPVISSIAINNDVFAAEGLIFGEVFVDHDGDGKRGAGEGGVPNAAIFLDSGEYAVTDSLGRFSLPRVFAGYRTVRLDEASLAPDLTFTDPLDGLEGRGRENERLVHLLPAGHVKLVFPLRKKPPPPVEVTHSITCQEKVSINKQMCLYKAFTLLSSYFAFGKADLMKGAAEELHPVVEYLLSKPDWRVFLEGHTDSIPINTRRFPSNMELSIARAQSVMEHLGAKGIAPDRVITRGYGENKPLFSNQTIEGRRLNRRVEVSFIPPGVRVDGVGNTRIVNTTITDLSALPDTFHVKIFWEMFTPSWDPGAVALAVQIPERFHRPEVEVKLDGRVLEPRGGAYDIRGFKRSGNIRCEISFAACNLDTAYIDEIELVLDLDQGEPQETSDYGKTQTGFRKIPKKIIINPYQGGRSTDATTIYELARWRQMLPAEIAAARAVETATADPSVSSGGDGPGPRGPGATQPMNFQGEIPGGVRQTKSLVGPAGAGQSGTPDSQKGAKFALIEPRDGDVFSRKDQIVVHVRLPVGGKTVIAVNGDPVSDRQMGQRIVDLGRGVEELIYYGVKIQSGWNTVLLKTVLLDGAELIDSVRVALASRVAVMEPVRKRVLLPSDGHSTETIRFSLKDHLGLPVVDGTLATVLEGDSVISGSDARPAAPGFQISSENGYFSVQTRPGREPRRHRLVVECDGLRAACEVAYTPAGRPMFAAGLVDLKLGVFNKSGSGSPLGLDEYYDGAGLKSTSRLFMQGAVTHGVNLTARLDTRKRYDDPLLKEDNPDKHYPVYGDASTMHFAAPARGGNYVSLDKGESYVRYGDFRTPFNDGEFLSYHRAANGFSSALISGNNSFKSFITKTDFSTFKDEMRADGTSGFYYLDHRPVVENSERIFLETRNRYQLENVIELKPLVRNRDYTINHFDGSILFKEAVSATDRNFNPVYIVAIYEVDMEAESQYLYGVRGDVSENKHYRVGAAAVARSGDGEHYALFGVDGKVELAGLKLGGEFARSDDGVTGNGNAFKLEAGYKNDVTNNSLYLRRVDGDFSNPSFRGSSHELSSVKSGFKSKLNISSAFAVEADGFMHRLNRTEEKKSNARAVMSYRHTFFNFFSGIRVANHEEQDEKTSGVLSVVGISAGKLSSAEIDSRWEKNLGSESVEDYPDRLKTTVAVPFWKKYKFVASHEYLTAAGRGGSNQAAAGVESRLFSSTTAYTKYSMNRTAGDDRMGAVAGLKQAVRIRKGLSGTVAIENFYSLSDREDEEYVSVKTGLSCRKPKLYLAEGQYEYRWQKQRTKHLLRFNASRQLSDGFAALLKEVLAYSPDKEKDDAISYHGRLGLVYRPLARPVTCLLAMRNTYERYTPVNPGAITWKLVLSSDVNLSPAESHELRLKYAFKHVEDYSYGIALATNADLFLTQYIYHFARYWDVDLWGRALRLRGGGTVELGAGIEVGRLFLRCLRVGAGYSLGGFEDPDFTGTDAWSSGFGLRVQLILSDWALREFGSRF